MIKFILNNAKTDVRIFYRGQFPIMLHSLFYWVTTHTLTHTQPLRKGFNNITNYRFPCRSSAICIYESHASTTNSYLNEIAVFFVVQFLHHSLRCVFACLLVCVSIQEYVSTISFDFCLFRWFSQLTKWIHLLRCKQWHKNRIKLNRRNNFFPDEFSGIIDFVVTK